MSIEDEGLGLAPEQRARMFDRFVRFNNIGSEERGTELGLAICRTVTSLHKGDIYAEPGPGGRGLRVGFELPAESAST